MLFEVDVRCRDYELDNLRILETSSVPSIGLVGRAKTAVAYRIRIGDRLSGRSG